MEQLDYDIEMIQYWLQVVIQLLNLYRAVGMPNGIFKMS